MRFVTRVKSFLRVLLRRDRVESELGAELKAYVELLTDEKMRAGMSPRAARRAALLELGGMEQVKERVRDAWLGAWASALVRDVRHSVRLFARAPGFTAAVVISLGLGVGGTTAIFSVLNAVLLRPLPYPDAQQLHLVRIWWGDFSASLSPADLGALRQHDGIVSVGAYFFPDDGFALQHPEGPEVVQGAILTPDLPTVLGIQPLVGHTFGPDRDAREVLIAETLWREQFGGRTDAIGRTLLLDGEAYTIVGVMPAGFGVPPQSDARVWVKFEPQPPTRRGPFYLNTIARLAADSNAPSIATRLTALSLPHLRDRFGVTEEWRYGLRPLKDAVVGDVRPTLRLLGWAVPLVLVIGVLNFSNLLLARGLTRRHEIGVRAALGAGRGRIAAQLMVEAGLLGLLGGTAGLAVAWMGLRVAQVPAAAIIPRMNEVHLDASVIAFALAVGMGAGLMAGVLPALRLPWSALAADLRDRGRGFGPGIAYARVRRLLVSTVVSLTLTVLVSAALLVKSLMRLESVDPGFDGRGVLTFRLALPDEAYPDSATDKLAAFLGELKGRIAALPGVSDVAFSNSLPPDQLQMSNNYTVEGSVPESAAAPDVAGWILASEAYFDALQIPVLQGRAFTPEDRDGAPGVIVVNEAFVRRHSPGEEPLGKRLKGGDWDADSPWLTIVGVAGDVPYDGGVWAGSEPTVYTAYAQNLWATSPFVVVRADGDPLTLVAAVRDIVQSIDRMLPLRDVATMRQRLYDSAAAPRLRGRLFMLLAVVALALAVNGVFGVLAYDVNQHRHDIAVKRALGATSWAVVASVVRSGLQLVAAGAVLGVAGGIIAGRLLAGMLYGVSPHDLQVVSASVFAVATAAFFACLLPARNAARIDPMKVLRQE